jgi:hypothetical protein
VHDKRSAANLGDDEKMVKEDTEDATNFGMSRGLADIIKCVEFGFDMSSGFQLADHLKFPCPPESLHCPQNVAEHYHAAV